MRLRDLTFVAAAVLTVACSSQPDGAGEFDSFGGNDVIDSERADGAGLTRAEADAILRVVNTASFEVLDDDVALDVRAARNIVEARQRGPIATLDELDAIPWVGSRALGKLREYVLANGLVVDEAETCLIISEYVEGKHNDNKAVEIWNCGASEVVLDDVALCLIQNDDEECTRATALGGGTLAPDDTMVLCRDLDGNGFNDPYPWLVERCDVEVGSTAIFSGDDRLALVRDTNGDESFSLSDDQLLDVLGRIGYRPPEVEWKDVRLDRCRLEPNDGRTFYLTDEWFHVEPWSNDRGSHLGQPPTRTSCDDPLAGVCVFGSTYRDIIGANDAVVTTSKVRVTSPAEVEGIEAEQLLRAVQVTYDVDTIQEAFAAVDAGEVNIHRLWDASNGVPYIAFEFGAGDNSYGRVFAAGTDEVAADIIDGDLYGCTAFWGPQRRDCSSNDDCADGLRCEGRHDGTGSCIDTSFAPAGTGSQCTGGTDCPGSAGLVCAGENLGGGFCVAAWSRRAFELDRQRTIPARGRLEIPIDVYGLATVSTDVTVDLVATNDDYENLRISLQNPLGTTGTLFEGDASAREVWLRDEAVLAFPGDEDANGQWLLVIENPEGAVPGLLYDFRMTVTSRYD